MTEPTDAELIALLGDRQFSTIGAVREALRRWGTPPAGAGEHKPGCPALGGYGHGVGECCCDTAPQPTQAQTVAVPLTCEWAHNEDDGFWDTECGQSWRFDDGGPKENHMNFCHCCGKPLRIKGGQHDTE